LQGETNHAGTTPMEFRKDALLGLADFAHEIGRILEEVGTENSRATVGKAEILPGAPNSVPGRVDFSLDFRDPSTAILTELSTAFDRTLLAICRRRGLASEIHAQGEISPVAADQEIVNLLTSHAKSLNISHKVMPSGAAHDAQLLGKITSMGMIFVPSKGGLSHSPAEATDWEDIEAGANLLLHTLLELSSS
jgi:N-carbamoyl-L-amino-acid hydrolase